MVLALYIDYCRINTNFASAALTNAYHRSSHVYGGQTFMKLPLQRWHSVNLILAGCKLEVELATDLLKSLHLKP